ncbi:hypothetical protein SCUP515_04369 [Seiridium cupressi]
MRHIDHWREDLPQVDTRGAQAFPGKVYPFETIFIGARFLSLHLYRLVLAETIALITTWIEDCGACVLTLTTQRQQAIALAQQEISEINAIVPFYCNTSQAEPHSPFGGMTVSKIPGGSLL